MFSFATRRPPALPEGGNRAPASVGTSIEERTCAFLLVAIVVLASSVLGLASRHAFSVAFWPANAVLVGLMLRNRRLIRTSGWAGAFLGFVAGDLLFGNTLSLAAFFAVANIAGTLTATVLLLRLDERDLRLRRVHSMLRILACLLPACFVAALGGALLVIIEFGGSALQALLTWPASELVNYLTVLPAMLTMPARWRGQGQAMLAARQHGGTEIWPALALVLSCVAAVHFDGPGSIMFPMPGLLLCALTYSIPTTALLTMALGAGCLTTIGLGVVDIGQDMSVPELVVSARIAVAFLVMVPLTIGSGMAVRDDLLNQLRKAADHDGLTGLLNRRAFEQRMAERLSAPPEAKRSFAVLWLDIDHFKEINDQHGHLAGDAVLQAFAATARSCCRETDLIGRWGGEEFALVVEVSGRAAARTLADRLRKTFAEQTTVWNGVAIRATVSIGAYVVDRAHCDLPSLILQLDKALYRAKRKGRNRIEWLPLSFEPEHALVKRPLSA